MNSMNSPKRGSDRPLSGSSLIPIVALAVFLSSGCVNILAQNAPGALRTAESRAKFELNCPDVQASILSQKTVEGVRFEGSEHTIGVRGCGRQIIYVTYCRDADDCNALSQSERVESPPGMLQGN